MPKAKSKCDSAKSKPKRKVIIAKSKKKYYYEVHATGYKNTGSATDFTPGRTVADRVKQGNVFYCSVCGRLYKKLPKEAACGIKDCGAPIAHMDTGRLVGRENIIECHIYRDCPEVGRYWK